MIENTPRLDAMPRASSRGRVIIHALNAFGSGEQGTSRGNATLLRVGGENYPAPAVQSVFQLWRAAFAPHFEVRQIYALSVNAAPAVVKRIRRSGAPLIFSIDRNGGKLFPALGDFFVMDLEIG